MKTRQDIDLIDRVGVFYAKNDTELLWSIRLGGDWMKTRYENYVTDCIDAIHIKNETKLPCPICDENQTWRLDRSYWFGLRQNRNWTIVTYLTVCGYDENQIGKWHNRSYKYDPCWKRNWNIMTNRTKCGMWWKPDWTSTWLIV